MSLPEELTDRPLVERSRVREGVTTDRKQTCRLYPSIPQTDWNETRVRRCSPGEKLQTSAGHHPDTQPEASSASSDVSLRAHILVLEDQRQELLSINEKWAKEYRTMKHHYTEKVKGLRTLLPDDHSNSEEEAFEEGQKNLTLGKKSKESTKTGDVDVSLELLKAEREAKDLRAQNSTLTRKWQIQSDEIRRLNKALQAAFLTTQPPEESSETLQEIWKHQAQVYKEDFQKERKDREKLKEKYLELETKFRKVHRELRSKTLEVTNP